MFLDRLITLCSENNTDISNVLKAIGLSTSKGTAWRKGSIPNGEILLMLANYFRVSTDYLLGNTDDPTPAAQKEKPPARGGELIGPNKQALLSLVEQMSDDEAGPVLEIVQASLKMREKK